MEFFWEINCTITPSTVCTSPRMVAFTTPRGPPRRLVLAFPAVADCACTTRQEITRAPSTRTLPRSPMRKRRRIRPPRFDYVLDDSISLFPADQLDPSYPARHQAPMLLQRRDSRGV